MIGWAIVAHDDDHVWMVRQPREAVREEGLLEVPAGKLDVTDERVDLFRATRLTEATAEAEEEERIEIVRWPLGRLGDAIADCRDSKSLIALLLLERLRRR